MKKTKAKPKPKPKPKPRPKAKPKAKTKAKSEGKGTAKKSATKSEGSKKKPVDLVRVREIINNLVGKSAREIATGVIEVAKAGQLASAKYLFEAVGLYPATEQTAARPPDNSLAHTLLTRMGLPLDPVICDEDPVPAVLVMNAKGIKPETTAPRVGGEEPAEKCEHAQAVVGDAGESSGDESREDTVE